MIAELQRLLKEHVEAVRMVVEELRNLMTNPPIFTHLFGPSILIGDGNSTLVITENHLLYGAPAVTVEGLNLDVVDPDDECIKPFIPLVEVVVQLLHVVEETPYDDTTCVSVHHTLEVGVWNMNTGDYLARQHIYPAVAPPLATPRPQYHRADPDADAADANVPDDVVDDTPMPREYWRGYEEGWSDGAYQRPKQVFPSRLYRRGYHRGYHAALAQFHADEDET